MKNPRDEILRLAGVLATARCRRAIVGRGLAPCSNETPASTEARVQRAKQALIDYLHSLKIEPYD